MKDERTSSSELHHEENEGMPVKLITIKAKKHKGLKRFLEKSGKKTKEKVSKTKNKKLKPKRAEPRVWLL